MHSISKNRLYSSGPSKKSGILKVLWEIQCQALTKGEVTLSRTESVSSQQLLGSIVLLPSLERMENLKTNVRHRDKI